MNESSSFDLFSKSEKTKENQRKSKKQSAKMKMPKKLFRFA